MDQQVSGQAASAGDVQTSEQEGHEVPFVPETPQKEKKETEQKSTVPNEEAKEWRKSDKDWQAMVEKTKDYEDFKNKLAESLGLKPEQVEADEDLVKSLQKQMTQLQEENVRTKWEASHPIVNNEDHRDEWTKICKEKGHLVTKGDLTYDDLWRLIRKEPSRTPRDYKEQDQGSVPVASKSAPMSVDIDPEVMSWFKQKHPNLTEEQIRALGK